MTGITMPDFESWSQQCWTPNRIAEALEQAFNQGLALGRREALTDTQEWWEPLDSDITYQEHVLLHTDAGATIDLTLPEDK